MSQPASSSNNAPRFTDPWRSVNMAAAAAEVSWLLVWIFLLRLRPLALDGSLWWDLCDLLDVAWVAFVVYVIFTAPILYGTLFAQQRHGSPTALLVAVGTPIGNAVILLGTLMTIFVPIGVYGWAGAGLSAVLAVLPRLFSWGCLLGFRRKPRAEDAESPAGTLQELARRQGLGDLDVRVVRPGDIPYPAASTWRSGRGIIYVDATLLEQMNDRELGVVASHEAAHLRLHHVRATFAADVLLHLLAVTLAAVPIWIMVVRAGGWWYLRMLELAPIAGLWLLLARLLVRPAELALSRRQERQANLLALELTRDPAAFVSAMQRLAALQGATREPSRWQRWFLESHPSLKEVLGQARQFAREHNIPLQEAPQEGAGG